MAIEWQNPEDIQVATQGERTPEDVVKMVGEKIDKFTSHYFGKPVDLTNEAKRPQNLLVEREFKTGDRQGQKFTALKIAVSSSPVRFVEIPVKTKSEQYIQIKLVRDNLDAISPQLFQAYKKVQQRMRDIAEKKRAK